MTRERFVVGTLAVAFGMTTMTVMSAWAGQDRPSNGNTVGTATPRGGDGGGSATPRGGDGGGSVGSSSSSSGGGDMGGSSSVGPSTRSTPSPWSSFDAPSRSNDQSARPRSGGRTTGQATPRDAGGSSSPRGSGSTASAGDRSSSASADQGAPSRRAVPAYSRPRDGRPVTGTATDRGSVIPPGGGNNVIVYPYYPWGFWGTGYGYGLGYLYYDPFWSGGYGFGYPYGYGGYGGYGYGGYGGGGGYGVSQSYRDTGSLRLKISPRHAQVYIDGYYVGVVDSFDGAFQKLGLESGGHRVELKADGYEPLQFDALITPGETVTYKGEMKRIQ